MLVTIENGVVVLFNPLEHRISSLLATAVFPPPFFSYICNPSLSFGFVGEGLFFF